MSERIFWQFHLISAIVMMLTAAALLPVVMPVLETDPVDMGLPDWLKLPVQGLRSDFKSSQALTNSPYKLGLVPKEDDQGFFWGHLEIRDAEGHLLATYPCDSYDETPFFIRDDVLFWPQYDSIATGCVVHAFDLSRSQDKWVKELYGIGRVLHDKYRNKVSIALQNNAIIISGHEASGSYIEVLDAESGKTLGHQRYNMIIPPHERERNAVVARIATWLSGNFVAGLLTEVILRRRARK